MRKQQVIEAGEDLKIRIKNLPEKAKCLEDKKQLKGFCVFRDFLVPFNGKSNVLVTAERDAMPQHSFIEEIKPYKEQINTDNMAHDAEAHEISIANQRDANYIIAQTMRIVVLGLVFIFIIIAIMTTAGSCDMKDMMQNWMGSFG